MQAFSLDQLRLLTQAVLLHQLLKCHRTARDLSWTFEEVDAKLKNIMTNIFHNSYNAAKEYGLEGNLVAGANIAGFLKVADAMKWQGIAY